MTIDTETIKISLTKEEAINLEQLIGRGRMFYTEGKYPFALDSAYKKFGIEEHIAKRRVDFADLIMDALSKNTEIVLDTRN